VKDPNPKCWHYDQIDKDLRSTQPTCINCINWGWTKCKDEALLMNRINETENLMRHDGFRRSSGALRQTRHGS